VIPAPKTFRDAVLVVCPSPYPPAAISGILEQDPVPVTVLHSPDCQQALAHLAASIVSVVICETDLPDGSWKDLLDYIERAKSSTVLVVTSQIADESLWAEVLNLGAYDVLAQPFDREEVTRVVKSAVMASSREGKWPPA
jgi:DNA-binding NtrC family response regulator